MALPPKIQETLDDLSFYPERADRIQYLIELADEFVQAPADEYAPPHPESNRVPACESEVFTFTKLDDHGKLKIEIVVENPQGMSAMAMGRILQEGLNGEPPTAAQDVPEDVVYTIFGRELSMGKSMGLTNMVRLIKAQAAKLG